MVSDAARSLMDQRIELEKQERREVTRALEEVHARFRPEKERLYALCLSSTGHTYIVSGYTLGGHALFVCQTCSHRKREEEPL